MGWMGEWILWEEERWIEWEGFERMLGIGKRIERRGIGSSDLGRDRIVVEVGMIIW